jgi:hypothetical protein
MLEFLTQNWLPLLAVVVVLAYVIYLSVTKQWVKVREFAYKMMLVAERTFGDDQGRIKFDFVVKVVYNYIPVWLRVFVKEQHLEDLIQEWYETAKDYLDDGEVNNSVK